MVHILVIQNASYDHILVRSDFCPTVRSCPSPSSSVPTGATHCTCMTHCGFSVHCMCALVLSHPLDPRLHSFPTTLVLRLYHNFNLIGQCFADRCIHVRTCKYVCRQVHMHVCTHKRAVDIMTEALMSLPLAGACRCRTSRV